MLHFKQNPKYKIPPSGEFPLVENTCARCSSKSDKMATLAVT